MTKKLFPLFFVTAGLAATINTQAAPVSHPVCSRPARVQPSSPIKGQPQPVKGTPAPARVQPSHPVKGTPAPARVQPSSPIKGQPQPVKVAAVQPSHATPRTPGTPITVPGTSRVPLTQNQISSKALNSGAKAEQKAKKANPLLTVQQLDQIGQKAAVKELKKEYKKVNEEYKSNQ